MGLYIYNLPFQVSFNFLPYIQVNLPLLVRLIITFDKVFSTGCITSTYQSYDGITSTVCFEFLSIGNQNTLRHSILVLNTQIGSRQEPEELRKQSASTNFKQHDIMIEANFGHVVQKIIEYDL